jgi:hypothetical protein
MRVLCGHKLAHLPSQIFLENRTSSRGIPPRVLMLARSLSSDDTSIRRTKGLEPWTVSIPTDTEDFPKKISFFMFIFIA